MRQMTAHRRYKAARHGGGGDEEGQGEGHCVQKD